MAPKLYMAMPSPPVRAVLMVARAINLNLENAPIDFLNKEHLTPEYLKLNPQHTVPTLVDENGFTIWDSHAIGPYLISKYAPENPLLPKDIEQRAIVDQRLHFDSGVLFPRLAKIVRPIIFEGKNTIEQGDKDSVNEAYEFLEKFLEISSWIAGDDVTVADYAIIATVSSLNVLVPLDATKFPNVVGWVKKVEDLPAYEANKDGLAIFRSFFEAFA